MKVFALGVILFATQPRFDVFERFFAADFVRFQDEAREANAIRGASGISVSNGPSCTDGATANPEAKLPEDPYFALGQRAFGRSIAISEFMGTCELPDDAKAEICVAVKDRAAVGVTVRVVHASADVASCIDRGVRGLAFPE